MGRSVSMFTSDPTKPVSSAAVWSTAEQAIGKQDEVLKLSTLELNSELIFPRRQFFSPSVMCMPVIKLQSWNGLS